MSAQGRALSLRARLLVWFVVVAVVVVAVVGGVTYLLVRATARETALDDLEQQADDIAAGLTRLRSVLRSDDARSIRQGLNAVIFASRVSAARIVFLGPGGEVIEGQALRNRPRLRQALRDRDAEVFLLPPSVAPDDLDGARLAAGEVVRGTSGSTAFVARPLGRSVVGNRASVLVLTRDIAPEFGRGVGLSFALAALAALAVSTAAAFLLSRRLTRPYHEMQSTATKLADGDLSARVPQAAAVDRESALLTSALNTMAERLESAQGAGRSFLLSVSHDLRTPLTSIRGYAAAISDGTIDSADRDAVTRAGAVIETEARRLERLVRDLLDLARLDAREFSLHPQSIDVADVVRDAAEAFRPAASDHGLALDVRSDGPVRANLDPERLAQLVANLVENALKYATATVTVGVSSREGWVEVSVADDGPGIDSADVVRVFERLYTARSTPGRPVGTGLGLAIVRELAHAMDGAVRAQQLATGGTRLVVDLPT